ncbi:MAG: small multi-drug export protein [bacterium]
MAQEVIVFLAALAPIIEVRGAVPLGILVYHLDPVKVILISIIGSIIPIIPILWFLNTLTERLKKIPSFNKFIEWLFARTRSRSKLIEDFELVGLTIFVGIPFPGTGVWTGCVAAYLLGLPLIPTFVCASIGTTIASLLMWAASTGIITLFH